MLVLSRKCQESLSCVLPDGREIVLHVVGLRGNSVRLGVTAPPEVRIVRTELQESLTRKVA